MAETIIDRLVVTLGLDSSGMKKGKDEAIQTLDKTKDQAVKVGKEIEASGKNAAQFYSKIKNEALGFFAVIAGGKTMQEFYSNITRSDAAMGLMARNMGMSSDNLTEWTNASKDAGGSAEATASSLQGLVQNFQQLALTGQSSIVPYFRSLGIAMVDAHGKMRPMDDLLYDIADHFKSMNPATAQAIGRGMGIDEGTINLLLLGRAAVHALIAEQEQLGHANSQDTASALQREIAMRKLEQVSISLGRSFLTTLTPSIDSVTKAFTAFGEWARTHQEAVNAIFIALAAGITGISIALGAGAIAGLIALGGAAGGAALAIGGLVAAIGLIAGGWTEANKEMTAYFDRVAEKLGLSKGAQKPIGGTWDEKLGGWTGSSKSEHADRPAWGGGMAGSNRRENAPRGIRNHNPGNLEYAGQPGASIEDQGRFAKFPTMESGLSALANQLKLYGKRGNDTVSGIISKFAPPNENNTSAYINSVSRDLGVNSSAHLNLESVDVLRKLMGGITKMEVGAGKISLGQINAGIAMSAGAATNNHSETHINTINVTTQATDATGIARGIKSAIENYGISAQSNYSLN